MATTERETINKSDGTTTTYTRESRGTGWFVGVIVVLALLAIGYLIYSSNMGTTTDFGDVAPSVETTTAPAVTAAPATVAPAAPAASAPAPAPAATAPATAAAAP